MADKKYLDLGGVTKLWQLIKSKIPSTYASSQSAGGAADKAVSIPFGQVDNTSTATVFTATVDGITELRDGVCVYLKNGVITSASGFTLNVNGLGAKPCYSTLAAASRATTLFNINYTMLFVYNSSRVDGGCWDIFYGYDSNTNTIGYQLRTYSTTLPMAQNVYRYRLLFTSADGTQWVPANTSTSTNATATRTVNQTKINPFGKIVYYGYTTAVDAGSSPSTSYMWTQNVVTLGYSFNSTGAALVLDTFKPVYIKCAPQSDGSAIIDADNPYVQALPSTADGKIYIFLGIAVTATTVEIIPEHPIYCYRNGRLQIWTGVQAEIDALNSSKQNAPLVGQVDDDTANDYVSANDVATAISLGRDVYLSHVDNSVGALTFTSWTVVSAGVITNVVSTLVVGGQTYTLTGDTGGWSTQAYFSPSDTSELTNSVGFITLEDVSDAGYVTSTDLSSAGFISSGDDISSLNNDAGYITAGDIPAPPEVPEPSNAAPIADGAASAGVADSYAREDHVHPTDTTRQAKITASGLLKGDGNGGVTAAVAGTDYLASAPVTSVNGQTGAVTVGVPSASSVTPQGLGVASIGQSNDYARADHRHEMPSPSDIGASEVPLDIRYGTLDMANWACVIRNGSGNGSGNSDYAVILSAMQNRRPLLGSVVVGSTTVGICTSIAIDANSNIVWGITANNSGTVGIITHSSSDVITYTSIPIPTASSATPAALGTAAAGNSTDYARADHVHAKPTYTASDVGAIAAPSSPATGSFIVYNGSAWTAQTLATWQGGNY